jgi:hypothetical protein
MNRRLLPLLLLPLFASCAAQEAGSALVEDGPTHRESALAADVVRDVTDEQDAARQRFTVVSTHGVVKRPDSTHPCLSGRELRIKLIDTFPHIGAMPITTDTKAGESCLIGIEAPTKGEPLPIPTLDPVGTPLPIR